MRRGRITLFLFGVIALLALLCAVFPGEGLWGFRFPQLRDVLAGDARHRGPTPEELALQRHEAVLAAERGQYREFLENDPARFYLPGGDETFFDSLFVALDSAGRHPIRIIHYGDSQIEEDRITGTIRSRLQERFGGIGPGMLPAREYATRQAAVAVSPELQRYFIYGDATWRAGIRKYGPYADFNRMDSTAFISFFPVRTRDGEGAAFDRLTLVAGNQAGSLSATVRGESRTAEGGEPLTLLRFELPDSTSRVSLRVSGRADLYGILLDGKDGVRMDNVPMRGSGGTFFTAMDPAQLRSFYAEENVRLILLQYGGNSLPYLKTDKAVSQNLESLRHQIRFLQELAPDAKIVFIGPSDMSTTVAGKRKTWPRLPAFVDSLKLSATQCGAAYWDIYGAMGGEDSMIAWAGAQPPLAGQDYIHFTLAGAQRIGEMFCDAFFLYYDYYRWRKDNE
ncbi:MAG: hypothetical protein K5910_06750 [Bacteroidales bacterium]|nr:hypothetical protein [Bacteroidales bacterium]